MILKIASVAAVAAMFACSPAPKLTATQVTCNAFAAYEAHPSKATLETVLKDSLNVPGYGRPGLVSDIGQLWADSAGGGKKYIADDNEYIREDGCGGAN